MNDAYSVAICDELEKNAGRPAKLGVVHQTGGQIGSAQYSQQLHVAGAPLKGVAEDAYRAVGLALLRVDCRYGRKPLAAFGVDPYRLEVGVQSLLDVVLS